MPSERRYGVLRLLRLAAVAAPAGRAGEPRAGRLLLDVARAAGAGARATSTARITARTATSARATSPSTSASSATSRSPSGSASARACTRRPRRSASSASSATPTTRGANKDILGFAVVRRQRSLRPQRAHVVPARGQAPDDQVQRLPQGEDAVGDADVLEGADGVRRAATTTRTAICARTCAAASAATTPRRGTCSTSAQFDHDRDTRYPLEKKHEPVKCAACHFTTQVGRSRRTRRRRCRRPTRPAIRS